MQPYVFPYIGYFQLINAVDKFVIYDDVNFIKQGWITRNRILLDSKDFMFILRVEGASSFRKINEIKLGKYNDKLLNTFTHAYKYAPLYPEVFPLIEDVFLKGGDNLSGFITYSLKKIAEYLGIKTELILSSDIDKNNDLKAKDKVIEICRLLNGTQYVNSSGGQDLYSKEDFLQKGIDLKFLKSTPESYKQYENDFVPMLSIVDVMMFNLVEKVKNMLNQYELV